MTWKAWANTIGTRPGSRTVTDHLVTGFAIASMSTAWKSSSVQPGPGRLAGDAQDRDRVGQGRVEAGDHIGAGRPRGADANADIAMLGARIAVGHVRGALDMPRQDVADRAAQLQGRIERVDRRPRDAEGAGDALLLQHAHSRIDGTHLRHVRSSRVPLFGINLEIKSV
jgi:hypothetical protein